MKTCFRQSVGLAALIAWFGLMLAGPVTAQTFTSLYSFSGVSGQIPNGLIKSENTLYGTTYWGGINSCGTAFRLNTDGTGFTNLHFFYAQVLNPFPIPFFGTGDGAEPMAGVVFSNKLYGVANYGGSSADGTIFAVNTDGSGFTNLYSFTDSDGSTPEGGLILLTNTLYGTTSQGGSLSNGTLFAINADGTGFTNTLGFTSDGSWPKGIIASGNKFYGIDMDGGGCGTIFALNIDGTGFTNLHVFNFSDGCYPAGLVLSGDTLFGTATQGGPSDSGTLFAVKTDGTGFTNLHFFTGGDGESPYGSVVLSSNTLYAMTTDGGSSGKGTLFAIKTDGTGFTNLFNFSGTNGAQPIALILSRNTFYGTTQTGGKSNTGTVFSLAFTPQLSITATGASVILTWPTNVAGFDYTGYTLQSTADLGSPAWSVVSPPPAIVNGLNTVTNPISGTQMFYRLVQ